ncbi:MAG TPA: hypothetical protein VKA84_12935 [Gemmatimonadaceae bacterium]|nr:hypothetical protein [Gemmatimonadaceae bacterium]
MLTIRDAQLEALSQARWKDFERRAVRYLEAALPAECASLGAAAVRESVQTAIRKGRAYGLVEEYDFLRYLNLMYALGFDFDTSPAHAWAREILDRPGLQPRARMDLLTDATLERERAAEAEAEGVDADDEPEDEPDADEDVDEDVDEEEREAADA